MPLSSHVERIANEQALAFLTQHHAEKEYVFIRDHAIWFGAFVHGELVGVGAMDEQRGTVKLAGLFVAPQYRGQGIASSLVAARMTDKTKKYKCYATRASEPLYRKLGFRETKFRTNICTLMKWSPGDGKGSE